MARKIKVSCKQCEKTDSFVDTQDINYSKWKIIGWNINENEPICLCPSCEWRGVVRKAKTGEAVLERNK